MMKSIQSKDQMKYISSEEDLLISLKSVPFVRCRGKRKEAHYNYLSSDFEYHRSTKAAIAHMKTDPNFTQEDIDKLIRKTNEEGKKLRPDKYDWMDGDESVPEVNVPDRTNISETTCKLLSC